MISTFDALSLLRPWDIDVPKIRIGDNRDGGYVLVSNLEKSQPVLSYGIGSKYDFDTEMAQLGHSVYMFDHTIKPLDPKLPTMHFFSEGVGAHRDEDAKLDTIDAHIAKNHITSNEIILKIDVEGAEFDVFDALPLQTLRRFRQIALEVHAVHRISNLAFRQKFFSVFSKINLEFTLCHVHVNNFDGPDEFRFVDNMIVPQILELTYVRKDLANRRPSTTVYPTALDYPNTNEPDKLLWMYPFAPMSVSTDCFRASFEHQKTVAKALQK